jgi:hypothetical protein
MWSKLRNESNLLLPLKFLLVFFCVIPDKLGNFRNFLFTTITDPTIALGNSWSVHIGESENSVSKYKQVKIGQRSLCSPL